MMTDKLLLDSEQVAALLSMNRKAFYHFLRTVAGRTFPAPLKLSYRVYRWKRSDVEEWVNGAAQTTVRD